MERGGGRPKDVELWKQVTVLEGKKKVKCNHCGFLFAASANRIKYHIYQIPGMGIRPCSPDDSSKGTSEKQDLLDSQGSLTASSSGTSSGSSSSSMSQNSESEEDLQVLMDLRKRKGMITNRDSEMLSPMRKQKHLGHLVAEVAQRKNENQQILTSTSLTTEHYLRFEAENSVLRAQATELRLRLESLSQIIDHLTANNNGASANIFTEPNNGFLNPMNRTYLNQPISASADLSSESPTFSPLTDLPCFDSFYE
ncbi:bZIP transcription factor 11-like [Neltuma alba]|uniref:bZIP transcription factor 11-like n=1 Tax=Neltuma alba TaxID=207710 RepID=UPI0010A3A9B5|nr:bZIP transcription factor 11-like [Prosopis alba]